MAVTAVTNIIANSQAANTQAAAPTDIETVFANLLAGMFAPAQTPAPQPAATQTPDISANVNEAEVAPSDVKAAPKNPSQKNAVELPAQDDAAPDASAILVEKPVKLPVKAKTTPDPAAMPVVFAAPNIPVPVKPVEMKEAAIADVMKAAKPAQAPAEKAAPAEKDAAPAKSADPAIVAASATVAPKPAPAVQTAQAAPVQFDAHAKADAKTDSNASNKDGSQKDQHAASQPQTAQALAPQAAPQPAHAQAAPQVQTAQNTAHQAPIAAIQQSTPVHVSATLQVHAQSDTPQARPDLADIAVTIATKSHAGEKHFDIRLDPPELGRIDVHLSMDDNGKAEAHLTTDKPQTLELLQRDKANLERAMKDAGVDLGNNGLNFSLKGEQRQASHSQRNPGRTRALSISAIAAPAAAPIRSFAPGSVQLDIRV